MSVHKNQLLFSEPAQEDFDDILSYTLETWGEKQLKNYQIILEKAFHHILENPYIGYKVTDTSFRVFK
jgi:toxin ParE1/3/4